MDFIHTRVKNIINFNVNFNDIDLLSASKTYLSNMKACTWELIIPEKSIFRVHNLLISLL